MAVVAAADLLAGPQIGFLPLLSLGPALAPVALGPGRTVLTGVLALLLSGLLARYDGTGLSLRSGIAAATGGRVRVIIADVQGKGLPAVQTAAVVLGTFREGAHDALGLTQIADQIDSSLERQAPEEKFVTAVRAEINPGTEETTVVNRGHPALHWGELPWLLPNARFALADQGAGLPAQPPAG